MARQVLTEATTATTATPVEGKPGRFLIQLITPGWGSSGYYSPEVLEAAAKNRVFAKGTHMYLDHPTASEQFERPERSVRDLAAVLAEDATYTGGALVAEAQVFGPYREALGQMAESIGVSIRAAAEITEGGEAEGRRGRIIDALVEGLSADYVTHAGRGGKILQVLESARDNVEESRNIGQWIESRIHRDFTCLADDMAGDGRLTREERIGLSSAIGDALAAFVANLEAGQPQLYTRDIWADPTDSTATEAITAAVRRAVARGVAEATANDTRDALEQALREEYGSENTYVWVRDFDDTTVWFQINDGSESGLFAQAYALNVDGAVALTGERTEVRQVTTYVPVNPAGQSNTQESKEDTMATTQIEESDLARLREDAGRVTTLESERDTARQERDTAIAERDEAREANAAITRDTVVARIVGEASTAAGVALNEFEAAGVAGRRVLAEDGTVDEAATRTAFDTAIASIAESRGSGQVRGFGGPIPAPSTGDAVSEADLDALDDAVFGQIKEA